MFATHNDPAAPCRAHIRNLRLGEGGPPLTSCCTAVIRATGVTQTLKCLLKKSLLARRKSIKVAQLSKTLSSGADNIADLASTCTTGTEQQVTSRTSTTSSEAPDANPGPAALQKASQEQEPSAVSGRRIVAMDAVLCGIDTLCAHSQACFPPKVAKEVRTGLVTGLNYLCHKCGATFLIGENKEQSDLNHQAVHAAVSTGSGYSAMKEQMACMEVPFMAFNTFSKLENDVAKMRMSTFYFRN